MGSRKGIFLDIDGTLTLPGKNDPPISAQRAVQRARERGHQIFLCTGRSYSMTKPLLSYGFDGAVMSAGGIVIAGGRRIFDCPIQPDQLKLMLELLENNSIYRILEGSEETFCDQTLKITLPGEGSNSEMERWIQAMSEALGVLPMEQYNGDPIYKIVVFYQKEEQLEEPRRLLEKDFEFCLQAVKQGSAWLNGELIDRRFSKGSAIRLICKELGIPLEDTIGVGDSMNDLAMIEVVGTSVCMGDGSEGMREKCDLICPEVQEDGLEKAFQELGLI